MIAPYLDSIYDSDFYEMFGAEYSQLELIESLLKHASITEKEKEYLYSRLRIDAFTVQEAEIVIEYLYENQIDRVLSGFYYSQTDIKNKLKRENELRRGGREIPQYKGYYAASNLGNIKSLDKFIPYRDSFRFRKGRVLKTRLSSNGYEIVTISVNNNTKTIGVHQLVAMAFMGHNLKNRKIVIDHKDNNKTNNVLSNLQIVTNRYNVSKDNKGVSKYVGVCWSKNAKKWMSSIRINGKKKYLGYFKNEYDAHLAYQYELEKLKNETRRSVK